MAIETSYRGLHTQTFSNERSDEEHHKNQVSDALNQINSRPSGNQLLDELSSLARRRGHKVTIHELGSREKPSAVAVLSRDQIEKHEPEDFSENTAIAGYLAGKKKGLFSKSNGEGSSVIVNWSPSHASIRLNENGSPVGHGPSRDDNISSLAHELVHAKHMMAGTWKGGEGDPEDPTTSAGKEEFRAVGLGQYRYSRTQEPSENSIRAEHGLPLRTKYKRHGR